MNFIEEENLPDSPPPEFLVELVTDVSIANGIFRVTLAQQDKNDQSRPIVRLLVPANQFQQLLMTVNNAATEIEKRISAVPKFSEADGT